MSGNNKHSVVVKSITRRPLLLPQILLRQHVCSTTGLRSFLLHELSGLEAEPCDQIGEARGVRLSSRSQRTYGLIGVLGAFSPGLKPGHCKIKRSRGFENPLPRTESPGLARIIL